MFLVQTDQRQVDSLVSLSFEHLDNLSKAYPRIPLNVFQVLRSHAFPVSDCGARQSSRAEQKLGPSCRAALHAWISIRRDALSVSCIHTE